MLDYRTREWPPFVPFYQSSTGLAGKASRIGHLDPFKCKGIFRALCAEWGLLQKISFRDNYIFQKHAQQPPLSIFLNSNPPAIVTFTHEI
jgi:hypothetical protein